MSSDDPAVKKSISMPKRMLEWVDDQIDGTDIKDRSHYIQRLIAKDMRLAETPDEPKKAAPEGTGTGDATDARPSTRYSGRFGTKDVKPRGSSRRKKP